MGLIEDSEEMGVSGRDEEGRVDGRRHIHGSIAMDITYKRVKNK